MLFETTSEISVVKIFWSAFTIHLVQDFDEVTCCFHAVSSLLTRLFSLSLSAVVTVKGNRDHARNLVNVLPRKCYCRGKSKEMNTQADKAVLKLMTPTQLKTHIPLKGEDSRRGRQTPWCLTLSVLPAEQACSYI